MLPCTPVDPFLSRVYLARIAREYITTPEAILSRSRLPHLVECRQAYYVALRADGYTAVSIGVAAGRDHSSVFFALKHAADRPEVLAVAQRIRELLVPDELPARDLEVQPAEAEQLRIYCWWLIGRRAFDLHALAAIRLLARRPALRERLSIVLRRYRCYTELWRVEQHAHQIGATWAK